jgi:hypothetical protein
MYTYNAPFDKMFKPIVGFLYIEASTRYTNSVFDFLRCESVANHTTPLLPDTIRCVLTVDA